MLVKRF